MRSLRSALTLMATTASVATASSFTKQLGGSDMEISKSTSIRSATGDMCVAGFWMGASTTMGGTTLTNALAATSDAYVAKLDTDGNVAWAKSWGGSGDEFATSAFDKSGNVGVSGYFVGATMTIAGMSVAGTASRQYAYVAKLDSSGAALWTSSFGSSTSSEPATAMALTFDSSGNLYAAGSFKGTISLGGSSYTSLGGFDGIVIKYDSTGTVSQVFTWGDASGDEAESDIKVDSAGNVYVLGKSTSTSLTIGSDSFTGASSSSDYTVLFKLDRGFNVLWAKQIGGVESGSRHLGTQLQIDSSSNVYVTGSQRGVSTTIGTEVLTGAGQSTKAGYVASFTSAGDFRWAKNLAGSSGTDFMTLTLTDDDYYLRIGGMTGASSLAVGSSTLALKGVTDCFLLTINAATGDWVGGTSIGASSNNCQMDNVAYPSTDTLLVTFSFMTAITSFRGSALTTTGASDFDIVLEQFDTSVLGIPSMSKKTTTSGSHKTSQTLVGGAIAGIVIAVALMIIIGGWFARKTQQMQKKQQEQASELPVVVGQQGTAMA